MIARADETPTIEKGKSKVVINAEAYAQNASVYSVAATMEYIFLNHGQDGIVSVYNWEGNYCFTIVTSSEGNGIPEIYCVDKRLYLIDKQLHVFVYDGERLIQDYQIKSAKQASELLSGLKAQKNKFVTINGSQIVDENGNLVFSIPYLNFHLPHREVASIATVVLGIVISALLIVFRSSNTWKEKHIDDSFSFATSANAALMDRPRFGR